jgi:hypothetical protein
MQVWAHHVSEPSLPVSSLFGFFNPACLGLEVRPLGLIFQNLFTTVLKILLVSVSLLYS